MRLYDQRMTAMTPSSTEETKSKKVLPSAKHNARALPVGYRLRQYIIGRVMGSGGFGITYEALNLNTGERVIIKENFPQQAAWRNPGTLSLQPTNPESKSIFDWALKHFVEEAKTLSSLQHDGIVSVLDYFEENDTAYYTMQPIIGAELQNALPEPSKLTEEVLTPILLQLLDTLRYLHERPVPLLHRDIKVSNILLNHKNSPILIDFGLARKQGEISHMVVYSEGYTPIEQISGAGDEQSPRSDIYALGATCYRLIVGTEPPDSLKNRLVKDTYIPLKTRSELHGRFSSELLAGIDKALEMHAANRWESAKAWADSIRSDIKIRKEAEKIRQNEQEKQRNNELKQLRSELKTERDKRKKAARKAQNAENERLMAEQEADNARCQLRNVQEQLQRTQQQAPRARRSGCGVFFTLLLLAASSIFSYYQYQHAETETNRANYYQSLLKQINEVKVPPSTDSGRTNPPENTPAAAVEKLKQQNISPSQYNEKLFAAAREGHTELLQLLLAAGAGVNITDKDGNTPLNWAAWNGHINCVRALLAAPGIDVNLPDKWGQSPLYCAATRGHDDCVRTLLSARGVEINRRNNAGYSPLKGAELSGHSECARLLRDAGAI